MRKRRKRDPSSDESVACEYHLLNTGFGIVALPAFRAGPANPVTVAVLFFRGAELWLALADSGPSHLDRRNQIDALLDSNQLPPLETYDLGVVQHGIT